MSPMSGSKISFPKDAIGKGMKHLGKLNSLDNRVQLDPTTSDDSGKISVPQELLPYLKRIKTKDIMEFLNNQGAESEELQFQKHRIQHCAWKVLSIPHFDLFMGLVILLNLVVMILETDRSAAEEESASGVQFHWAEVFGWIVLLIFVFELLIRLLVYQRIFWQDPWNIFDFTIVSVDAIFTVVGFTAGSTFPVSILRIFRLAKLARVFKILRVFPALRLLLAGLISSISAIFWGTLLLFFCLLVWSMVAVLFIHPLMNSVDFNGCDRCPRAYSSTMQAMLTFWQAIVTGDSWGIASIPVIEQYPSTAVFFVAVYLSVGMAVTNLILGVVVNVAQQAQDALSEEDNTDRALAKLGRHTHLLELCKQMDTDDSGELSHAEVYAAFEAPGEFRDTILSLEISKEDFDIVWAIIDADRKGHVSYKELVSVLSSMNMSDSTFMLSYIKYYITLLKHSLLEKMDVQHKQSIDLERRVEETIERIEEQEADIMKDEHDIKDTLVRVASGWNAFAAQAAHESNRSGVHHCDEKAGELKTKLFGSSMQEITQSPREQVRSSRRRKSRSSTLASNHASTELRDTVATLQVELKGILMDMNRKLDRQAAFLSGIDLDITSSSVQHDLLVVPGVPKQAAHSCSTLFCEPERHALKNAAKRDGASAESLTLQLPNDTPRNWQELREI